MIDRDSGMVLFAIFLLIAIVLVANLLLDAAYASRDQTRCLEHGYPDMERPVFGQAYCIKRSDGRDVVVPLRELEGR